MSAWVIEANDVSLHFAGANKKSAGTDALRHIDMQIAAGQLIALVGPDGAGKTSLMRLMTGLMKPTSGQLHVLGFDVVTHPQAVQDRISYMPQRFGLYEDLSVRENFELYADLHGVAKDIRHERYTRLMQMTDLTAFADRPAGKLSGGMKQKLGLACTLVRSPELLLLDEPTVGVDPLSRRELWRIITQLIEEEHLSVIVSTTSLDEAEHCAQVHVMYEGQVLVKGAPEVIRHDADGLCYVAQTPEHMPSRELQVQLFDRPDLIIDAVPQGGNVCFVKCAETSETQLKEVLHDISFAPVAARLEDGFMVVLRQHMATQAASPIPVAAPETIEPPSLNHDTIIEVKDLVRTFGDFTAVASTTFSVQRGEVFGLLGPNGAGKTTTFRMLCGLLPASSGFLQVAGVNLRTARAMARRKVGYVSQKFALYGSLSVLENLTFYGRAYGLTGDRLNTRIATMLQQFDLTNHQHSDSGALPGGFKQRLSMAVALLHEPDVLFLDEPTSGADTLARREFWRRITVLAEQGTTIVITTHFMEEAEYCDRVLIQDAGRVLALGTPNEVRRQTGKEYNSMDEAFIAIIETSRAQQAAAASNPTARGAA